MAKKSSRRRKPTTTNKAPQQADAVAEAMANSDKPKPGVGRPPGPTDTTPPAVVRPASCPTCHSTEYTVARIIVDRAIAGTCAGQRYDHVIWRRLRCKKCGQLYTARFYEYSGQSPS